MYTGIGKSNLYLQILNCEQLMFKIPIDLRGSLFKQRLLVAFSSVFLKACVLFQTPSFA